MKCSRVSCLEVYDVCLIVYLLTQCYNVLLISTGRFIELFRKYHGFEDQKLKLKRPTQLQEVLNIARDLLTDIKEGKPVFEKPNKIHQLRTVLEM